MAKILYGVHGTAHGHAIRALTVARRYPEHEFLFVSHADGAEALRPEFRVVERANPVTPVKSQKVAFGALIEENARFFLKSIGLERSVVDLIEEYKPDAAMTDYEYLVPRACRRVGLPCLSLDHQHITTFTKHLIPRGEFHNYFGNYLACRLLFTQATHYIVTSFFRPPRKRNHARARIELPLYRQSVLARTARSGRHIVSYQSSSTFERFFPLLKATKRPVFVYGFDSDHRDGTLTFKRKSEESFLDDLSSCAYVICGGGHSAISEALYYGKPVMSFPVRNAFEQRLNAHYVEALGYGRCFTDFNPDPGIIATFEADLDRFRANIAETDFFGNERIFSLIDAFIRDGKLPEGR